MNKRFTLKESSIYNRNDVIHDNGIELSQSTACDLLNELYDKSIRLSKDKQLAETALMEYKEKVKNELELRYCLSNHKPVYQFMAEKLDITLEGIYDD
jgi:hypothetical protein